MSTTSSSLHAPTILLDVEIASIRSHLFPMNPQSPIFPITRPFSEFIQLSPDSIAEEVRHDIQLCRQKSIDFKTTVVPLIGSMQTMLRSLTAMTAHELDSIFRRIRQEISISFKQIYSFLEDATEFFNARWEESHLIEDDFHARVMLMVQTFPKLLNAVNSDKHDMLDFFENMLTEESSSTLNIDSQVSPDLIFLLRESNTNQVAKRSIVSSASFFLDFVFEELYFFNIACLIFFRKLSRSSEFGAGMNWLRTSCFVELFFSDFCFFILFVRSPFEC
jgi:hypothetical protein